MYMIGYFKQLAITMLNYQWFQCCIALKVTMPHGSSQHCLRYDPEGTASKKVKQNVRQDEQDSLDQAVQEFQKQQMMKDSIYKIEEMESEEKMECNICLLDGCGFPAEDGKRSARSATTTPQSTSRAKQAQPRAPE